jgi:hypothetical protein
MSGFSTEETLDHGMQAKPKQPIFLIVLCIISWIENGYYSFQAFKGLAATGFQNKPMPEMDDFMNDETISKFDGFGGVFTDAVEMMPGLMEQQYYTNWLDLIGGLLICFFVFLMFQKRKAGFIPYMITKAVIIAGIISLAALFSAGEGLFAGMALVGVVFSVIYHVAFIVMFGLNRKHLIK